MKGSARLYLDNAKRIWWVSIVFEKCGAGHGLRFATRARSADGHTF